MASLGFIGVNLALVLVVLQIFVDKCKGAREIAFWNFVQCVITGSWSPVVNAIVRGTVKCLP